MRSSRSLLLATVLSLAFVASARAYDAVLDKVMQDQAGKIPAEAMTPVSARCESTTRFWSSLLTTSPQHSRGC